MNIVSLFSGAGGLDLGFEKAGFNIILANEYDKKITPTYKLNHPSTKLFEESILSLDKSLFSKFDITGIIGGPPCQSWSLAGNMKGKGDTRGKLVDEYIRIVKHTKPKFFIFENVKGIISKTHKESFNSILNELKSLGYDVKYNLLNAVDYGVSQTRERVFIVGFKKEMKIDFVFPSPISNKLMLSDIIDDLPAPKPYDINEKDNNNNEYFVGSFSSMFMSRNRIRNSDQPSFTIQASARQTPLHYSSPEMVKIEKDKFIFNGDITKIRRYSIRECARIQGFSDDFNFIYENINDGYKMIGNAVPVNLAFHIAKKIIKHL